MASSIRLVKEGGVDAIKLEGGAPKRVEAVRAITDAGIAVMGHVGLTPQAVSRLGGFRAMGRTLAEVEQVLTEARALEDAGCFSVVLECVPAPLAAAVTKTLSVPTIGIGAGAGTSGQVLVYHDLLTMMSHPHHQKVTPAFCKHYGEVVLAIHHSLGTYGQEVRDGVFPSDTHTPYHFLPQEEEAIHAFLAREGLA